jgi:hypothetical protein
MMNLPYEHGRVLSNRVLVEDLDLVPPERWTVDGLYTLLVEPGSRKALSIWKTSCRYSAHRL